MNLKAHNLVKDTLFYFSLTNNNINLTECNTCREAWNKTILAEKIFETIFY